MVKTGTRATVLLGLIARSGHRPSEKKPPPPRLSGFSEVDASRTLNMYRALGGQLDSPMLRPGSWDLAFDNGFVIELDEELHFNRYRRVTLDPPWATALPWHTDYVAFAADHESACLAAGRWGKRWTNPSASVILGPAGESGDFDGGGAPRWKQRALYDAMKDIFAVGSGIRLARLSVWDAVDGVLLGDALDRRATLDGEALVELIRRRTTWSEATFPKCANGMKDFTTTPSSVTRSCSRK